MLNIQIDDLFLILLFIFEGLFLTSFIIFFLFFLKRRRLLNEEYRIKNKFNEINQVSVIDQFKYLTILAKNNDQLKNLMNDINKSKKFFNDELKSVKDKIICLTELNEKFSFKSASVLKYEIIDDLNQCSIISERFKKILLNSTTYSKNISELLVRYRSIFDKIMNFYEFNLSLKYSNQIFKNMVQIIEETLFQTSKYVLKIDNNNFIKSLNQLNEHIFNFYKLIKNLYVLDHSCTYVLSSINFIKNELKNKSKILSSNDLYEVEKKFAIATNNAITLQDNLKKIEINSSYNHLVIAIKNIELTIKTISQGDKVNVLVQKSLQFLNNQIKNLTQNTVSISKTFLIIKNFFQNDDLILLQKVDELSLELQKIALSYQNVVNEYKHYNTIERHKFLGRIKELMIIIKKFKQKTLDLVNEISLKYKNSIMIIDEISDIKLTLAQLLGIKIKMNSSDEASIKSIETIFKIINDLEAKINADYFNNYDAVHSKLQEIKDQIFKLIKTCSFDNILKTYAQKMITFLNKYRNEAQEIDDNLNLAEKYYDKNKYEDTLNLLIDTLTTIKNSAKINKVSFN